MKDILFDLDGTVVDSGLGITNSVIYTLKKYGFEIPPREELYKFIGPPLAKSFSDHCGLTPEGGQEAVEVYREYYREKGVFENTVYEGFEEMLKALKEAGARIFLATSKPEIFAKKILEHSGLDVWFDGVGGSELDGSRVDKGEVIEYVMKNYNITDGFMVGDRKFDILGAKEKGLKGVGVLYGYGTREEIEEAGADFIAEDTNELKNYLLKHL